nr:hypothetical protein Iba_scaffold22366CG0010 [Ipomoea batatas]
MWILSSIISECIQVQDLSTPTPTSDTKRSFARLSGRYSLTFSIRATGIGSPLQIGRLETSSFFLFSVFMNKSHSTGILSFPRSPTQPLDWGSTVSSSLPNNAEKFKDGYGTR